MNIAGVNLEKNKKVPYALMRIKGIGLTTAFKMCQALNISLDAKIQDLGDSHSLLIRDYIEKNLKVGNDLTIEVAQNISRLVAIRCYRGIRHQNQLPTRGQRTHANAETRRGKKKGKKWTVKKLEKSKIK